MGKIKVTPCDIKGLYVIEPTVFKDERGYFVETYNQNDFREAGLNMVFVQDNQYMSVKGVLRGLHFQKQYPQGKLVRVVRGTYYINLSIFLAFAASYPDMELLLYFILPIKIKWMGLVYGVYILYQLATGNPASRIVIISSLLNFVVFFLSSRNLKPYTPKEQVRKAKFRQQTRPHMTYANGAKHRCAVCGRTELDDSSLEFRFCSKCNGNYEYCQDHLFTHQHVK